MNQLTGSIYIVGKPNRKLRICLDSRPQPSNQTKTSPSPYLGRTLLSNVGREVLFKIRC